MGFRRLAGMIVLLACMAAYWLHFEKRFAALEAETALKDSDGQLTASDRERLLALRAALQRDFGVTARLVVRKPDEIGSPPAVSGDILYMAVTPQLGAAEVRVPTLLARALTTTDSPDPERRMVEQLNACVRRNAVGVCLQNALLDMLVALEPAPGTSSENADLLPSAPPKPGTPATSGASPASGIRRPLRTTPPPAISPADAPPSQNFSDLPDPRTPYAN